MPLPPAPLVPLPLAAAVPLPPAPPVPAAATRAATAGSARPAPAAAGSAATGSACATAAGSSHGMNLCKLLTAELPIAVSIETLKEPVEITEHAGRPMAGAGPRGTRGTARSGAAGPRSSGAGTCCTGRGTGSRTT